MSRFLICLLSAVLSTAASYLTIAQSRSSLDARSIVRAAIARMGVAKKRYARSRANKSKESGTRISSNNLKGRKGPWIVNYEQTTEQRDLDHQRLRRTTQTKNLLQTEWSKASTLVIADGVAASLNGEQFAAG